MTFLFLRKILIELNCQLAQYKKGIAAA